jgi:hypothetical protein
MTNAWLFTGLCIDRAAGRLPCRLPPEHPQESADDAWAQMTAWFKKNGVLG